MRAPLYTLWLALALAPLALAAPALAVPVIPAGSEQAVLALVAPFEDEGRVVDGVTLASVRIAATSIELDVRDGTGATATLRLRPRERDGAGPAFAREVATSPAAGGALAAALQALDAAVAANDDGSFPFRDVVPGADGPAGLDADTLWRVEATAPALAALWLALLLALALQAWSGRRLLRQHPLAAVALLLLFAVALWWRLRLGYAPLHANDHAYEDAAVALELPSAAAAALRHAAIYGDAFRLVQRLGLAVVGAHFDGLAQVGAFFGAVAATFGGWACARAARAGGLDARASKAVALVGGLALATTPLATRVAGSESDLPIAQALLAIGLWVASGPPRRGSAALLACCCALLALGHVVGPILAAGLAGLAVALQHRAVLLAAPERRGDGGDEATPTRVALTTAASAGGAALLAGLWRLRTAAPLVAQRAEIDGVGVATEPWMLLARDGDYFAPSILLAALLAVVADLGWRQRRAGLGFGLAGSAALAAGAAALALASLLIIACVTDALRYQAVTAPALVVLAATAATPLQWLLPLAPSRQRALGWLALALLALDVLRPHAGATFADSQLAAYRGLDAAIRTYAAREGDTLVFIVARGATGRAALPDAPRGRWSARGPEATTLAAPEAQARCQAGGALPKGAVVYLPPSCAAEASAPPCAALLPFVAEGAAIAAGRVDIAQQWDRQRPPGEFLTFTDGNAPWSLHRARCPRR